MSLLPVHAPAHAASTVGQGGSASLRVATNAAIAMPATTAAPPAIHGHFRLRGLPARSISRSNVIRSGHRFAGSGSSPRASTPRICFERFVTTLLTPAFAAWRSSSSVRPKCGRAPVSACHAVTQNANWSVRGSGSAPVNCSGAM